MLFRSCINLPHVKLIEFPSGKSQGMLSEQQLGGRRHRTVAERTSKLGPMPNIGPMQCVDAKIRN